MDSKQQQQHRQHFNLSDSAKQMLEELTARRYPGKQRRQSQLIEDLITDAFSKEQKGQREQNMRVTSGMLEPEPEGLAPATREALALAQQEALRVEANAIYPEHLLLGVIAQGESRAAKLLCVYGLDQYAIRMRAFEVFKEHYGNVEELSFSTESQACLQEAMMVAEKIHTPLLQPEHLVISVLRHLRLSTFLDPMRSSISTLVARLSENIRETYKQYLHAQPINEEENPTIQSLAKEAFAAWVPSEAGQSSLSTQCTACKREVQVNWKHCVFCGASLSKICPQCGVTQPEVEGAHFCFTCGSSLE